MKLNLGLKLGSPNTQYTDEILSMHESGVFHYIELFVPLSTYSDTIEYWKQFDIPFGIHAPHSAAGLNLACMDDVAGNQVKIEESLRFADALNAEYVIFHSGTNGSADSVVKQLSPYNDSRILIENKPIRGLDGSTCVGCVPDELKKIIDGIGHGAGFCLDFGHGICAARTLGREPLTFIEQLITLQPRLYHLTDGDYYSELDSHLHYGQGSFPLEQLLAIVPNGAKITNEAKRSDGSSLKEFLEDSKMLEKLTS